MTGRRVDQQLATAAAKHIDAALTRAQDVITAEFIEGYVMLARAHGYDLGRGDVALVCSDDVPKAVVLIKTLHPVWVNDRLVESGQCLFVTSKLKSLPLYSGLNG